MPSLLKPNLDSGDSGSLAGSLRSFIDSYVRENLSDMLPASVVSYDKQKNRAIIQPLVMIGTTAGGKVARARCASVPVFRFGGGGFFIAMPLKPGDFGWIKANDRDISLILQRGGREDWPNTTRLHSFSDAMFFPDTLKDWVINGKNIDALVIQSMDGSTCIAVDDGRVEIDSSLQVKINATTTEINSNVNINGNLSVVGTMRNNSINVGSDHVHGGVESGSGSTGGPQ